jgi:hypothetical protein
VPNPSTTPQGNILGNWLLSVTLTPAVVGTAGSAEQTFTVNGLKLGDFIDIAKPSAQAGLGLGNARVSAANTLAVTFINATAVSITPTAGEVYTVGVTRPDNVQSTIVTGTTSQPAPILTQIT